VLLLGSGDVLPRQRARDQQADRAGLELKRRVLDAIAAHDPEPEQMEAALLEIVEELGPPSGPTRAIALAVFEDWRSAVQTPDWVAYMLDEAIRQET
jgi:hypothetical protein